MAEDDAGRVEKSALRDSEQAYRAHELRKVTSRLGQGPHGYSEDSKLLFEQAMAQTRMAICLTNPNVEDDPIIFANRAFLELTGYEEDEVIGRNCRFLQGPDTDRAQISRLRNSLRDQKVAVFELLNYRKNGDAFWNALHIGPIYDDQGNLLYNFGSQWDVTEVHAARAEQQQQRLLARELSHRMKNMFSVISSVVLMAGRGGPERRAVADDISGRILALGRAHEATLSSASRTETADLRPLLREILSGYDARGRISMEGEPTQLDSNVVSMLALTIHELATNAVKYGALSVEEGHVDIAWRTDRLDDEPAGTLVLSWTETGGPPLENAPARSGLGGSIIDALLGAARGEVTRDWRHDGLVATIRIPFTA